MQRKFFRLLQTTYNVSHQNETIFLYIYCDYVLVYLSDNNFVIKNFKSNIDKMAYHKVVIAWPTIILLIVLNNGVGAKSVVINQLKIMSLTFGFKLHFSCSFPLPILVMVLWSCQ